MMVDKKWNPAVIVDRGQPNGRLLQSDACFSVVFRLLVRGEWLQKIIKIIKENGERLCYIIA